MTTDRALSRVRFDTISFQLSRIAPSSQVIDVPSSLLSTFPDNNLPGTRQPERSCKSFSVPATASNQLQNIRRRGNISRSLWVYGGKLIGSIEYESRSIRTTVACKDEKESLESYSSSQEIKLCIRPPTWLLIKSWQALYQNTVGEWRFSFRTYNVVPHNAPVLKCI